MVIPMMARWDIISYCNLKCIHCRSEEFYSGRQQIYPSLEQAIQTVDTLSARGVMGLNILGGEPFAYRHLFEVMRYAISKGLAVYVTNNGLKLKHDRIPELLRMGVSQVTVSLDGSCPEVNDAIRGRGVFERAFSTLEKLIAEKKRLSATGKLSNLPLINVNCVLTQLNGHDVENLIHLCARAGVDSFRLSTLDEIGNARENLKNLWVSPADQLDFAEQLIPLVATYPEMAISILDLKPLVLEYLYEKTGVSLSVGIVGCSACTKEIYVQPGGFASPCLATAKQSALVEKEIIPDYATDISNLPTASQEAPFKQFLSDFKRDRSAYAAFKPCDECPYAGTLCKPCPLSRLRSGQIVEEMCLLAQQRMTDLAARQLEPIRAMQ
jgi:MoaA/NifB/PqqE/SkfB family radical SAM enzyme